MTASSDRRRYGRSREAEELRHQLGATRATRVNTHVWPDAYDLLARDAEAAGLTISGMTHHIIRLFYKLPPIP